MRPRNHNEATCPLCQRKFFSLIDHLSDSLVGQRASLSSVAPGDRESGEFDRYQPPISTHRTDLTDCRQRVIARYESKT